MKRLLILTACLLTGCMSFRSGPLPGEPKGDTYTTVRDVRIRYQDTGEGPAVVMLHGFAASMNTWDPIVDRLAEDHRVIRLDLKGFGWSGRPPGDYSVEEQARIVLTLLDELGVEETALVAHSWGSSVAMAITLAAPERITRIALYDAWVFEEQLPTTFVWSRAPVLGEVLFGLFYMERPDDKIELAFYDKDIIPQELVDKVERDMERPGTTAAALASVRGQRYEAVQRRYAEITHPVLLLWGADDVVTPVDVGHRLHKTLPDARLEVYERCGHFPMIEAYHPSTNALEAFLAVEKDHPQPTTAPTREVSP